jgi:hypothetical protein
LIKDDLDLIGRGIGVANHDAQGEQDFDGLDELVAEMV